jgi:pimeloyl-ACP methyl ester carboxylesterase
MLAGRSLLLLHGLTSSGRTMLPLARELSTLGATVSTPDLRGHGDDASIDGFTLDDFAADLFPLPRPTDGWDLVVAHSLGGAIAIRMAAIEPNWAKRLLMLDPVITLPSAGARAVVAENIAGIRDVDVETSLRENPLWSRETAELDVDAARQVTADVVRLAIESNLPWDLTPELGSVSASIRILGADPEHDTALTSPALGRRLATQLPNVEYELVEGSAHSIHRDKPAVVLAAIVELLS